MRPQNEITRTNSCLWKLTRAVCLTSALAFVGSLSISCATSSPGQTGGQGTPQGEAVAAPALSGDSKVVPSESLLALDPAAPAVLADAKLDAANDVHLQGLTSLDLNTQLGRVQSTCDEKSVRSAHRGRHVLILKQWHPSPAVNTVPDRPGSERVLNRRVPQAENQIALYRILESWISLGQIRTVLVEGCEYGITRGFEKRYNGWNLRALEKRAQLPDYASVITHLGLKLEAKLGPVVDVVCADDDQLLKAHDLAFSDARGISGFLARLEAGNPDDARTKSYLASVIELYKMPESTTVSEAVARLRSELKDVIGRIQRGFDERNKRMIAQTLKQPAKPLALVVGGAHATDLKARLEREGVPCTIVEPVGFRDDADALLSALQRWQ